MDWCVDSRTGGAVEALEAQVCAHLARHALGPALVELARPLVRQAVAEPLALQWVHLRWEDTEAVLEVRPLADGPVAGRPVAPGLTVAHDDAARLMADHATGPVTSVALGVARAPERDIDPEPADPGLIDQARPASVLGLVGSEVAGGRELAEAAARAGATLAAGLTDPPGDAGHPSGRMPLARTVADLIEAERALGGDFHLVTLGPTTAVLGNRRCPFGDAVPPAMCRMTSALAGGLAARRHGRAEVVLDERLALGDHQCRLVLDVGEASDRPTAHRYQSPPAGLDELPLPEPTVVEGFRVTLSLQLPRDRLSVPVTRHLVAAAMSEVGVVSEDAAAVQLAVTEACANVVDHSGPGDAYEVAVTVAPTHCHIRVIDVGRGFDHESLTPPEMARVDAEHGRGVALMHALVDQVRFESQPERGTVVHLVKRLHFDEDAPARQLLRRLPEGDPGAS